MECKEYENLITDYLENSCTPDQRGQMESHFSECESCRALAANERAVIDRLTSIPAAACPDEVIDRVMKKINVKQTTVVDRIGSWLPVRPSWNYAASLAGTALIVIMAVFLYIPYMIVCNNE